MAHIQDRWETVVDGRRVRTKRHGKGQRWKARYQDPDGAERSRMFDRKQDAERFLAGINADIVRGAYVDPSAGRITFAEFSTEWLAAQTFSESTREATELRIRLHAVPVLGRHELRHLKPSTIQAWLRGLQAKLAPTYVRTILTNVSAILNAAVDDGLIARNPCKAEVGPPTHARQEEDRALADRTGRSRHRRAARALPLPRRRRRRLRPPPGRGVRAARPRHRLPPPTDPRRAAGEASSAPASRSTDPSSVARGSSRCPTGSPSSSPSTSAATPPPATTSCSRAGSTSRSTATTSTATSGSRPSSPPASSPTRDNGMHALRHFYASALIDAGESASAVAEYLGHADPGFTLRVYAHLFPSSEDRARRAIDAAFSGPAAGVGRSRAPDAFPSG